MKGRVGGEERKVLVCCDVTIRGGSTQGHFRMSCRNYIYGGTVFVPIRSVLTINISRQPLRYYLDGRVCPHRQGYNNVRSVWYHSGGTGSSLRELGCKES